jgi:hypothetical protein
VNGPLLRIGPKATIVGGKILKGNKKKRKKEGQRPLDKTLKTL